MACGSLCTVNGQVWGWGHNPNGFLGVSGYRVDPPKRLPIPSTNLRTVQVECESVQRTGSVYGCTIWALASTWAP